MGRIFGDRKGRTTGGGRLFKGSGGIDTVEGLAQFARSKGFEKEAEKIVERPKVSFLGRIGRILAAFETGNALYQKRYEQKSFLKTYVKDIATGLKTSVVGREPISVTPKKLFKDILVKEGMKDRPGKLDAVDVVGLVGDILTDPTTFFGGFIGKTGIKGVKGVTAIARKTPLIKKPIAKTEDIVGGLFKPFHKIEKLGDVGKNYRADFEKYVKGTRVLTDEFVDEMIKKSKGVKPIVKSGERIAAAVETGTKTGNKLLDEVMDSMIKTQKQFTKLEVKHGILEHELFDYMHHTLTPEAANFIREGGDLAGFFKPIKTRLGAAKKRGLVRVVSEKGKDVSFKKELLGLQDLNKPKLINTLEKQLGNKTLSIQKVLKKLASGEIKEGTQSFREINALLRKHISPFPVGKFVKEGVEDFTQKEFDSIINGLLKEEADKLALIAKELESEVLTSQGREFLKSPLIPKLSRKQKIVGLQRELVKIQNETVKKIRKIDFFDFIDNKGNMFKAVRGGEKYKDFGQLIVKEINEEYNKRLGFNVFEEDAFKAFAKRGVDSIQALNTHDFLTRAGHQFGKKAEKDFIDEFGVKWVSSTAPELKGIRVPKPIAQHIDEIKGFLSNDESTKAFLRFYDKVLNIWKATVTGYFPAFHTRNATGGTFNNWIAGLNNPIVYKEGAEILTGKSGKLLLKGGRKMSYNEARNLIREYGIVGQTGIMDVAQFLQKEVNPTAMSRFLKAPSKVMGLVENNMRVPLFIDGLKKGMTAEAAAKRVIKFHFDYMPEGFTAFEKNIMKRVIPFYTWTRHNIPLQIEQLVMQPAKYAGVFKTQRAFGIKPSSEEETILPMWLKERFTLKAESGFWSGIGLPLEEATEKLSSPLRGFGISMSPFLKVPIERLTGFNIFKGEKISEDNYGKFYKNTPQPFKDWLELKEHKTSRGTVYYTVNPEKKYWVEIIGSRGINTAIRLMNHVDDKKNLLSLFTTIKKYDYGLEDLKRWSDKDKQRELERILIEADELREFKKTFIPKESGRIF
jgi:predicted hydrocarbon binding protein|tara:strand:- start:11270 stop:14338 length:3069 start_codon:yes stop_codon:yes gene_type:complete